LFWGFESFMYLEKDAFGGGICPKTSCELHCSSKRFSCSFLDLVVQSHQGISCGIFDKRSQPEHGGIDMICMPHVHSNISIIAKLGYYQ
jgi:hypothetical protein